MPIEFKFNQTKISFGGDILILGFSPKQESCKGVAWLLLQERGEGEIGRKATELEVDGQMCLGEQPGVLMAAEDPKSLGGVIDALIKLKKDLEDLHGLKDG